MKNKLSLVIAVIFAIIAAGLLLNYAGKGVFGETMRAIANNVTEGFGQ